MSDTFAPKDPVRFDVSRNVRLFMFGSNGEKLKIDKNTKQLINISNTPDNSSSRFKINFWNVSGNNFILFIFGIFK